MNALSELLRSPILWAAIVAAALAWFGVFLQNRAAAQRHRVQLQHDAEQRDREREMALRINVYLRAAEAIVRSQMFVGRLANIDLAEIKSSEDDIAAIAKVEVIGTQETVKTVKEFANAFSSYVFEIGLKRLALNMLMRERRELNEMADWAADQQRKEFSLSLQIGIDSVFREYHNKQVEAYGKEHQEHRQAAEALYEKETTTRFELMELSFDRSMKLAELIAPAVLAIRSEIDLPFHRQEYLDIQRAEIDHNRKVLADFMDGFKRMITEAKKR